MWIHAKKDQSQNIKLFKLCSQLFHQLSSLSLTRKNLFQDKFAWKVLAVEAFIWSLATYSFVSFFEWRTLTDDLYLDVYALIRQGLISGVFRSIFLIASVIYILRGSSKAHRVLVESILVLIISVPVGGISLISDININLDKQETVNVEAKLVDLYEREHRGRRGRRWYSYHISISPKSEPQEFHLPRNIRINSSLFQRLKVNEDIIIKIGQGKLNHPWIMSIEPFSNWQ